MIEEIQQTTTTTTESETTESETGETTEIDDGTTSATQNPNQDVSLQVLYESALMLRSRIQSKINSTPKVNWPPVASDFKLDDAEQIVPVALYNVLAWATGSSDDVQEGKFVKVKGDVHFKLLSMCQDLLSLHDSRTFLPKPLALALTMKHWTGSSSWPGACSPQCQGVVL